MTLVLKGISLDEDPLSNPLVGRFDDRGGEIGRSDHATFTLPDPQRLISRVHARISHAEQAYWIENVSSTGQILHNGRPLSSGMRVTLNHGDELKIGGYRLAVGFEHDATSRNILRGRTTAPIRVSASAAASAPASADESAGASGAPAPALPDAAKGEDAALAAVVAAKVAGGEALWRAFQQGLGVDLPLPNGPSPELFSAAGAMLRIAVGGIHRLISMRAVAKSELHADMTMIQVRGNNPLKFAPDSSLALKTLLQPPMRGFLTGPAALHDAVIDLQSHQVGVMAGMRAALEAVLQRFDPEQLEKRLTSHSVIESLIPSQHRARLWELYLVHYRTLSEEAQEDFNRFFGQAFLQAYDAQVRSLEAAAGHEAAEAVASYRSAQKVR